MATPTPGPTPNSTLNILILGVTGVGKSTFINAFANYIKFQSIAEAQTAALVKLIATSFDMMDLNGQIQRVDLGDESTETTSLCDSQTQGCKAYILPHKNRTVRLIDTPGIGDTRGMEQDRINTQNILAFISHYKVINGILILLKPNEARMNANFTFCFKELMCHLHKNSCDNIAFVFTNSRGVSYRGGDTMMPLRQMLKELTDRDPALSIPLTPERLYYLDNEGFRYIAALKKNIEFGPDEVVDYTRSWTKSTEAVDRLLDHISRLTPHFTSDMLSLNDARRLIVGFSKPLGDINQNLLLNIEIIEEQERKIEAVRSDIELLKKELHVPKVIMNTKKYDNPITVCGSKKCTTVEPRGKIDVLTYRHCHNPCHIDNVTPEVKNVKQLENCAVMFGKNCNICTCHWQDHMHLYYEVEQTLTGEFEIDQVTADEIRTRDQMKRHTEDVLRDLKQQKEALEYEQGVIRKIGARFAHFLKMNAIETYNDAGLDYMDHLIAGEQVRNLGNNRHAILDKLKKMKADYLEEKKILEDAIQGKGTEENAISPNEIPILTKELFDLPINGPLIKNMILQFEDAARNEHNFTELKIDINSL